MDYGLGLRLSSTRGEIVSTSVSLKESRSRYSFYVPIVLYKYQVDGITYTGSKLSVYSAATRTAEEAAMIANKYKVGWVERVYYSPRNPSFSLLQKDFPWNYLLESIILVPTSLIFSFTFSMLFSSSKLQK